MRSAFRARLAGRYIFFEMLPSFIIGVVAFVGILLVMQALRLTESILVHGVSVKTVARLMGYLAISFLPAILPMSLLFSVLMTFGRLSQDSEIVAMKAAGLNMIQLTLPAFILGLMIALASAETSFNIGPWGNRQFEVLVNEIGSAKIVEAIRGGTFSEGFYDLVVYAHNVDAKANRLEKVFIYDGRNEQLPLTIIAQEGRMTSSTPTNEVENTSIASKATTLLLLNGSIHRTSGDTYTKINFEKYDIKLTLPSTTTFREKSPQSLTHAEMEESFAGVLDAETRRILNTEYHKRWALSFACIVFSILGVAMGTVTNRRSARSSGLMISLLVIVLYWGFYVTGESLARSATIPAFWAVWTPNFVSLAFAAYFMRRSWS